MSFDTLLPAEAEVAKRKLEDLHAEHMHKMVSEWAYRKWEAAGRPQGRSEEFWTLAELDLSWARMYALAQLKIIFWRSKYEELAKEIVDAEPNT
jgi:hypothetical protein